MKLHLFDFIDALISYKYDGHRNFAIFQESTKKNDEVAVDYLYKRCETFRNVYVSNMLRSVISKENIQLVEVLLRNGAGELEIKHSEEEDSLWDFANEHSSEPFKTQVLKLLENEGIYSKKV